MHGPSHIERPPAPGPSRTGGNKRIAQNPQFRATRPGRPGVSAQIPPSPDRFVFFSISWLIPRRRKLARVRYCKIGFSSEGERRKYGVDLISVFPGGRSNRQSNGNIRGARGEAVRAQE